MFHTLFRSLYAHIKIKHAVLIVQLAKIVNPYRWRHAWLRRVFMGMRAEESGLCYW